MASPRINRVEIQGFRAFGKNKQELVFGSLISAVWAPNSQGKTSLAEAFEFLLTGQIVRRQLMASTQDEFADALRNAHMPAEMAVYVEAEIVGTDGAPHKVRRALLADYAKRQDCGSALEIDGAPATQDDLAALGIVLSQPPLAAPVLAQHTLGYLFSADRRIGPHTSKRSSKSPIWRNCAARSHRLALKSSLVTIRTGANSSRPPRTKMLPHPYSFFWHGVPASMIS